MWNEEQDNRHQIRVNKGEPQPPLENDGRKNKTKWRAAISPFGAPKRKLNPSDRDMSVKVGSGKIADLPRVEWGKLSWTAAGTSTRRFSKRYFPTVKGWEGLSERILFFLRSSGKSISKIKKQREQQKTEVKNMTIQNKAMLMLSFLKAAGISYKEFSQKTGISLD